MNQVTRFILAILFSISVQGYAAEGNYWHCVTHDASNKEWSAQSNYKKIALNYSFSACKKQSPIPATCKASSNYCEQFIQGISSKPMWSCLALDRQASPWRSESYTQRYDAALAAKAHCQQKSSVPDTCYVNLVACTNKNG